MHRYRARHLRSSPLHRLRHHLSWGGALIAAGVIVLLEHQGLLSQHELWLIAPAALAWAGLVRIALDHTLYALAASAARLALAAYLVAVIEQVGGWTFASTWPVLLIAVGVSTIAGALPGRGRRDRCDADATQEASW